MSASEEYRWPEPSHANEAKRAKHTLRGVGARSPCVGVLRELWQLAIQSGGHRYFQQVARSRPRRAVVPQEVRPERRFDELRSALVGLIEERRDARFDQIAVALQRSDVIRGEAESSRSIRHGLHADRCRDPLGQAGELSIESISRQRRGVCVAGDVLRGERRRFPRVVVRADFAVAAREQSPQDLPGACV